MPCRPPRAAPAPRAADRPDPTRLAGRMRTLARLGAVLAAAAAGLGATVAPTGAAPDTARGGAPAPASRTPTLASAHGNLSSLTTHVPPDRALLRSSVADALRAHAPFVVVFAIPKFCRNRTCGPVVDVVDAVRRRLAGSGVRF